tara:strand:+ start:2460 stop:3266 length:807 start_codon:yes stop_codon:yes gene_type:complete
MADNKKKNKNRDLLTAAYNISGRAWRDSLLGKTTKFAITNDATKSVRNLLIDKTLKDKEHVAGFAKYLTGGTVGNKPITKLSEAQLDAVKYAHLSGHYPEKTKYMPGVEYQDGSGYPNPNYNPDSTLLSTYDTAGSHYNVDGKIYKPNQRTSGYLGHADLKKTESGDYRLTDKWDVDNDPEYKPIRGKNHWDLQEGVVKTNLKIGKKDLDIPVASMAYDASKWLGINKDMDIDVKIPKDRLTIKKKKKKDPLDRPAPPPLAPPYLATN